MLLSTSTLADRPGRRVEKPHLAISCRGGCNTQGKQGELLTRNPPRNFRTWCTRCGATTRRLEDGPSRNIADRLPGDQHWRRSRLKIFSERLWRPFRTFDPPPSRRAGRPPTRQRLSRSRAPSGGRLAG